MSWSFSAIGDVRSFPAALDAHGESLTGDSKYEFELAKPHLAALIGLNANANGPAVMQVTANGHVSKSNGLVAYANCSVDIKRLGGALLPPPVESQDVAAPTQAAAAP